jgi:hypothetical protein
MASLIGVRKKAIPSEEPVQNLFMMTPGFVTERIFSFTRPKHHSSQIATATMHDS